MRPLFSAFSDELTKIAVGPAIARDPTAEADVGLYIPRRAKQLIEKAVSGAPEPFTAKARAKGIVALGMNQVPGVSEDVSAQLGRAARTHELTHYLRDQKGLLAGYGEPGLANVGRTAREEWAAYTRPLKRMSPSAARHYLPRLGPQFVGSVQRAYPGGVIRAAFPRLAGLADKLKGFLRR